MDTKIFERLAEMSEIARDLETGLAEIDTRRRSMTSDLASVRTDMRGLLVLAGDEVGDD